MYVGKTQINIAIMLVTLVEHSPARRQKRVFFKWVFAISDLRRFFFLRFTIYSEQSES
jgi:hypothetical protein